MVYDPIHPVVASNRNMGTVLINLIIGRDNQDADGEEAIVDTSGEAGAPEGLLIEDGEQASGDGHTVDQNIYQNIRIPLERAPASLQTHHFDPKHTSKPARMKSSPRPYKPHARGS